MYSRAAATVEPLLAALEGADLAPTIARNYERLPDFGHDVDVFLNGPEERVRSVFVGVARNHGWDYLTICEHYQNFVAYRFHHLDPPETLHVDVVGSLTLWGQTLCTARELCESRVRDPLGRFSRLTGPCENGYRLFQIESLLRGIVSDVDKIERYRERVLAFAATDDRALARWGEEFGMRGVKHAIDALHGQDWPAFRAAVQRLKRGFLLYRVRRNTPDVAIATIRRCWWICRERYIAPCGPSFKLKVGDREQWQSVLDRLVRARFLSGWGKARRLRERHFAFVRFTANGEAFCDPKTSLRSLARRVVGRHPLVYCKEGE